MNKKHNIEIKKGHTDISVTFRDDPQTRNSITIRFTSIADARQFAYELLEETMNFVINNNNNKQQ